MSKRQLPKGGDGASVMDQPEALDLLAQTRLEAADVRSCRGDLRAFLQRYLPLFERREQRGHATTVLGGLLSSLTRKTVEPIAHAAGQKRKNLQWFVGSGVWKDRALRDQLRAHVAQAAGDPAGVLILDPTSFPKKGTASVGVQRQWCGRLGKLENCQLGVFLGYSSPQGRALVDCRLFLPPAWAADKKRRKACHVPGQVRYKETWRLAYQMVCAHAKALPHAWVLGDEEFGRVSALRHQLTRDKERYLLRIPSNIKMRPVGDPDFAPPPDRRALPLERADALAARLKPGRWTKLSGLQSQQMRALEAATIRVQGRDSNKRLGPLERLLVVRTCGSEPEYHYALTNAPSTVGIEELVSADASRHAVEELFQTAKGSAGLDHYEVRSWRGWHHHMTLALLASWFLESQKVRMRKKKSPGGDYRAGGAKPSGLAPRRVLETCGRRPHRPGGA